MATGLDLNTLSAAICKGVVEGNAGLVTSLASYGTQNHTLRDKVQQNADKVWEIDGELKLLKGVIVSLVGSGDGSSGMVPRLERDLKQVGDKVVTLSSEVQELRTDVSNIGSDIRAIRESQGESKTFMDGWRGVGIAVGIMGMCATVIAGVVTALFWLFMHTGKM
jgi:outer membrane murein-binding lipoprotein Lpp